MVGLRLFCLVAHSHRKLKSTQVCLWDIMPRVAVRGILVCALLPVVPILFLLGTPGYISKRIKCDRTFYWRVLKVYFPIGTLLSRYSDYFKGDRGKTLLSKLFYF